MTLEEKALWVRIKTLEIHKIAPPTRVASCLSPIEFFTALIYGGVLHFNPAEPLDDERDRLILSKGHGCICYYPILADVGYFPMEELDRVGKTGSFLGGIPDAIIPGFETVNGSLGHGLGVSCGIAVGLKQQKKSQSVFCLIGDGELYEGSVWEAIMFAGHHKLDNLICVVDRNMISMLEPCCDIIDLAPYEKKFEAFGWEAVGVDGHNVQEVLEALTDLKGRHNAKPKVLILNTVKGKGVPLLETDKLCHLRTMSPEEIDQAIKDLSS